MAKALPELYEEALDQLYEEALDPSMASTEVWVGRSSQTERHDAENGWGTEALSVDPREDLIVDLVFDLPWKAEV